MDQLSFGSYNGVGPGDACGRCFEIVADTDPYDSYFTGPYNPPIVVKVTDLCPVEGNEAWCGQSVTNDTNHFGEPFQ